MGLFVLEVDLQHRPFEGSWPPGGSYLDGSTRSNIGRLLLIEASSNQSEFNSNPSASSVASIIAVVQVCQGRSFHIRSFGAYLCAVLPQSRSSPRTATYHPALSCGLAVSVHWGQNKETPYKCAGRQSRNMTTASPCTPMVGVLPA